MDGLHRFVFRVLFACASACCIADESHVDSTRAELDAHVRVQFLVYGPQSKQHEYFGYVYRLDGHLASAVVRGRRCSSNRNCGLKTAEAARLVPRRAQVLAEWHTHPHRGSSELSADDVRGAHQNRHISGYVAYYSKPNGDILAWDPRHGWAPDAIASLVSIGNYRTQAALIARSDWPGTQRR